MSSHFLNVKDTPNSTTGIPSPSSRSADYSNNLFGEAEQVDTSTQIKELKIRAHKSFMQVIQMQALYQQEIQLLKKQYSQAEQIARSREQTLNNRIKILQAQLKSNTGNIHDIPNLSFTIDNIQSIQCRDNQESFFNDSSILQIRQLLSQRDSQNQQKLKSFQNQLKKQIKLLIYYNNSDGPIKGIIDKLFAVFNQLNNQNMHFKQKVQQANLNFFKAQSQCKTLKIQYQSAQKQSKFLSQHIKRIHQDKTQLQLKIKTLQKSKKFLQDNIKSLKKNQKTNTISNYYSPKRNDCTALTVTDQLNISHQTQQSFKLTSSTKLQRITSENGLTYHLAVANSNPTKNFRKKQTLGKMDNQK